MKRIPILLFLCALVALSTFIPPVSMASNASVTSANAPIKFINNTPDEHTLVISYNVGLRGVFVTYHYRTTLSPGETYTFNQPNHCWGKYACVLPYDNVKVQSGSTYQLEDLLVYTYGNGGYYGYPWYPWYPIYP